MAEDLKPIPHRFTTPEELQSRRMETLGQSPKQTRKRWDTPFYLDVLPSVGLGIGSSFLEGFAGDAKTLNYIFDDDITKDAEHSLRNIADVMFNDIKPQSVLDAQQKEFFNDDWQLGEAWGDVYAYADLAGSGIGSLGAMILGGGLLKIVAKGGVKFMIGTALKKKADDIIRDNAGDMTRDSAEKIAKKQLDDIVEKYDTVIGGAAYGTAEMAIVSGSVGHSIEEEVMRLAPEAINTSPRFREIYFELVGNNKLTHDQAHNLARTQLAREAGKQGAKDVAIPTLILGTAAGTVISKALTGRMSKSTLANWAMLTGSEMPTEAAQGAYEQYTQNKVYKNLIDKTRDVMAGVPDSAFREGLGAAFAVAGPAAYGAGQSAQQEILRQAEEATSKGIDLSFDDLDDISQLTLLDAAAQVDEEATEAAMDIADPKEKWAELKRIIQSQVEGIQTGEDMDLDINQAELNKVIAEDTQEGTDFDLTINEREVNKIIIEDTPENTNLDLDLDQKKVDEMFAETVKVGEDFDLDLNDRAVQAQVRSQFTNEELGPFDTVHEAQQQRSKLDDAGLEIIKQPDGSYKLGGPVQAKIMRRRRAMKGITEPDIDQELSEMDLDINAEEYNKLLGETAPEEMDLTLNERVSRHLIPKEQKGPFNNRAQASLRWHQLGRDPELKIIERPDGTFMLGGQSQLDVANRVRQERVTKGATEAPIEVEEIEEIDIDSQPNPNIEGIEVREVTPEEIGEALPQIGVTEGIEDMEEIDMARGPIYQKDQTPVIPPEEWDQMTDTEKQEVVDEAAQAPEEVPVEETPKKAFVDEYTERTHEHPLAPQSRIYMNPEHNNSEDFAIIDLTDTPEDDALHLSAIQTSRSGRGNGSAGLKFLMELADKHGVTLTLSPEAYGNVDGQLTDQQLEDWYRRNGFEFDGPMMIREPGAEAATEPVQETTEPVEVSAEEIEAAYQRMREQYPGRLQAPIDEEVAKAGFEAGYRFTKERDVSSTSPQAGVDAATEAGIEESGGHAPTYSEAHYLGQVAALADYTGEPSTEPAGEGPVTMKGNRLYKDGKLTNKYDLLSDIDRNYLAYPSEYIAKDDSQYTSADVMEMYNRRVKNKQKQQEEDVPRETSVEGVVPEQAAKISGNTFFGLPKGLQAVALDPRVQEIVDEHNEPGIFPNGNGYWVYLMNGYVTNEGMTSIHEGNVKDVQSEMKYVENTETPVEGTPVEDIEITLSALPDHLLKLINVVKSVADLPKGALELINKRDYNQSEIRGLYHDGKIYIVSENLLDKEEAIDVFLHEAVGHLGLRQLLGKDMDAILEQVAKLYPAEMKALAKKYKLSLKDKNSRLEVAEELLADMAETVGIDNDPVEPGIIESIRNLFNKFLEAVGLGSALTKADVRAILIAARQTVMDGANFSNPYTDADFRFSIRANTAVAEETRPKDTVLEAIQQGQPIDAVFRAIWGLAEVTQLPKAVRITSAASVRGAMNFYDKHMPWAHSAMDYVAKGMIDRYKLTHEYKIAEASMESKQAMMIDEVRDIIAELEAKSMSAEDMTKVKEILENEAPREEAWDSITEPVRKRIEALGAQAVELNLITKKSYERNKGAYLHRVYSKYEQNKSTTQRWADNLSGRRRKIQGDETMERGKSDFVKLPRLLQDTGLNVNQLIVDGKGVTVYKLHRMSDNGQQSIAAKYSLEKPEVSEGQKVEKFIVRATTRGSLDKLDRGEKTKIGGQVKLWRDWSKQERKDLGEITDARYVLGKTFALLAHDLSTGEFFKTIADNPAFTWSEEEPPPKTNVAETKEGKFSIITGGEWVLVPDTSIPKSTAKRYGALAGKYVKAEIFQDLNQTMQMQKASMWKSILSTFKMNKTARNPVVHFNNIASNLVLMDLADVRFSDLYAALVEMHKQGDLYKEARAHGTFGVSFAAIELKQDVMNQLLDEIHKTIGVKPLGISDAIAAMDSLPFNKQFAFMTKIVDALWQGVDIKGRKVGLKAFDQMMLNAYQHEDQVFRLATYIRRRGQGMDPVEAGMTSRDQFLNYDIKAPWINALRASIMPFISYTYRAVPIVAKSIMQRPWKLAKYFTMAYAFNAMGYALSGGDEERERKSLRKEASGKLWVGSDRMVRMWFNDDERNPYFWDVRRMIPIGDIFDLNQHHAALPIIPASLMPSGPIALGFEFAMNKTSFFGEEIRDPLADDWVTATEKTIDWGWKSYTPSAPWMPNSYYWDKIDIAIRGGRDRLGREYNIPEALASSFGIKIARHDVEYGFALKAMEIERTVEAIRFQLSQLEKDYWQGKVQDSKYETQKGRYMRSLTNLEEEARELLQ